MRILRDGRAAIDFVHQLQFAVRGLVLLPGQCRQGLRIALRKGEMVQFAQVGADRNTGGIADGQVSLQAPRQIDGL